MALSDLIQVCWSDIPCRGEALGPHHYKGVVQPACAALLLLCCHPLQILI